LFDREQGRRHRTAEQSLLCHRNRSQCGQSGLSALQSPTQLDTFSRKNWPTEIIETFERHGFIWGGKWWHFDTIHFEYRPEIIASVKSVAASAPENKSAH